ncbi:thioredoxin [Gemmobacter sp.]|uniref:thioredoxin n=1 Tax=Gemmobacter sp. TaxID=1898957 RepID=UPI002AFDE538|nr:thioredoxin [Gemmobacter sp.]
MATLPVTDATYDAEVNQSPIPVVVDFWAEWCGPCRQIGPALEELSKEFEGKVKIVKINVDNDQQAAAKLGVRGIPALFLIKDGQVVSNKVGAAPKASLQSWIQSAI